ncbi:MAG: exopolysaccharide biosynthesis polyprenyl glycosylphosphotransferase, partial [Deltaproteobacteria bacterium]|nr:exopolysaccharide biosynthesis polyprenyl glycosylphosphotransferase [Deltaproteobacteria bacterium]
MLKEKSELIVHVHRLLDICLTVAAFVAAYFVKLYVVPEAYQGLIRDPNYYIILLMIIIIWYPLFAWFGLYESYRKSTLKKIILNTLKAVSTGVMVLVLVLYLMKIEDVSRLLIGIFVLLDVIFLIFYKSVAFRMLTHFRSKGYNYRNILIIGSKDMAKEVVKEIEANPSAGFRIMGCLDIEDDYIGKKVSNEVFVKDVIRNLHTILSGDVVDELIFAMPLRLIDNAEKYIALAEKMGVSVRIIPDWQVHRLYTPAIAQIGFEEFMGIPTMAFRTTRADRNALYVKAFIDYTFSIFFSLIFMPFFPFIMAAIKLSSSGPVFFKQERLGLHGRRFNVYKFRTMFADAEKMRVRLNQKNEASGPAFKIKKDPRIIPLVGTFLRKINLDELPQLINVLKGEMSLVGPR